MSKKGTTKTCPKCGKVKLQKNFLFCPKCGTQVKEANEGVVSVRPKSVSDILEQCGAKTEGEKQALLGSIGVSKESKAITGNVGGVSKMSQ